MAWYSAVDKIHSSAIDITSISILKSCEDLVIQILHHCLHNGLPPYLYHLYPGFLLFIKVKANHISLFLAEIVQIVCELFFSSFVIFIPMSYSLSAVTSSKTDISWLSVSAQLFPSFIHCTKYPANAVAN